MMTALVKEKIKNRGSRTRFSYENFCGYGKEKGALHAETLWNCDFRNGALQPALKYEPFPLLDDGEELGTVLQAQEIRNLFYFQYRDTYEMKSEKCILFLLTENGDCYQYEATYKTWSTKNNLGIVTGGVAVCNHVGWYAFVLAGTNYAYYYVLGANARPIAVPLGPSFVCACQERVFIGLPRGKILYSEPDQPWLLDGGPNGTAYLLLPMSHGEIVAMIAWKDKIYVFLEYGIVVLTPGGAPQEFRLEDIPYGGGRIFSNSAGLCGSKIFFLATDGLYAFDGKEAKRICKDLPVFPVEEKQICMPAVSAGKFLLRYSDRLKGDTMLIVFDGEKETGCFADCLKGMSGEGAPTVFYIEEGGVSRIKRLAERGKVFGESFFKSEALDFGKKGRKTLEKLYFKGRGSFLCRIRNGNRVTERRVSMEDGSAEISVYERGESFFLEFVFTEDACVTYVGADVYRGV